MWVVDSSSFQALERGTKNQFLMASVSFRIKSDLKGRQKRKVSVGHISVLEELLSLQLPYSSIHHRNIRPWKTDQLAWHIKSVKEAENTEWKG